MGIELDEQEQMDRWEEEDEWEKFGKEHNRQMNIEARRWAQGLPEYVEWLEANNEELTEQLADLKKEYMSAYRNNLITTEFIKGLIKDIEKQLKTNSFILKSKKNPEMKKSAITEEMIARAKEFPIERLVQVEKGFSTCPWHDDQKPSLYCRNNYAHCFGCGENADTIKLYMKVNNCDFKTAVRCLV